MDRISITSLTPASAPPTDRAIRAIVTLLWPYSSSTKQCALLLADPDFRLRNHKGQVRVRFAGASAEAVARARIDIGDEVELHLDGAVWAEDGDVSKTPGKSVDGELVYKRKLQLFAKKINGEDAKVNIDAVASPAVLAASPMIDELATPRVRTSAEESRPSRSGAGVGWQRTYASPAFVRRLRMSGETSLGSAFDPFAGDLDFERPYKKLRRSFGGDIRWKYSEELASPGKEDVSDVESIMNDGDVETMKTLDGTPSKTGISNDGTNEYPSTGVGSTFLHPEDPGSGIVEGDQVSGNANANQSAPSEGQRDTSQYEAEVEDSRLSPSQLNLQMPPPHTFNRFSTTTWDHNRPQGDPPTPNLQPIKSPALPYPSPFPAESSQFPFFSTSAVPTNHQSAVDVSPLPDIRARGSENTISGSNSPVKMNDQDVMSGHYPDRQEDTAEHQRTFSTHDDSNLDPEADIVQDTSPGTAYGRREDSPADQAVLRPEAIESEIAATESEEPIVNKDDANNFSESLLTTPTKHSPFGPIASFGFEAAPSISLPQQGTPKSEKAKATSKAIKNLFGFSKSPSVEPRPIEEGEPHKTPGPGSPLKRFAVSGVDMDELDKQGQSEIIPPDSLETIKDLPMVQNRSTEAEVLTRNPTEGLNKDLDLVHFTPLLNVTQKPGLGSDIGQVLQDSQTLSTKADRDLNQARDDDQLQQVGPEDCTASPASLTANGRHTSDIVEVPDTVTVPIDLAQSSQSVVQESTNDVDADFQSMLQDTTIQSFLPPEAQPMWDTNILCPSLPNASQRTYSADTDQTFSSQSGAPRPLSSSELVQHNEGFDGGDLLRLDSEQPQIQPAQGRENETEQEGELVGPSAEQISQRKSSPEVIELDSSSEPSEYGSVDDERDEPGLEETGNDNENVSEHSHHDRWTSVEMTEDRTAVSTSDVEYPAQNEPLCLQQEHNPAPNLERNVPLYPTLPPTPSASQSLQEQLSQITVNRLQQDTSGVDPLPTPHFTQPESSVYAQEETADTRRSAEAAAHVSWEENRLTQQTFSFDVKEAIVSGDMQIDEAVLREPQPEEAIDGEDVIQDEVQVVEDNVTGLESQETHKRKQQRSRSPNEPHAADQLAPKLPLSEDKATTSTEGKEPEVPSSKTEVKTPARKSLRSRLSVVPDALKDWFSPKKTSAGLEDMETDERKNSAKTQSWSQGKSGMIHEQPRSQNDNVAKLSSGGLVTPMSYFTSLSSLNKLINPSNRQSFGAETVDVFVVATERTKEPQRAKAGPKDFFTMFRVTDTSLKTENSVKVEVFRPWMATLPVTQEGDVVLLRSFAVKSRKRLPYLLSTDASAWCVWRYDGISSGTEERSTRMRTRSQKTVTVHGVREEMKGPPVEFGEEEREHARRLHEWWQSLRHDDSHAEGMRHAEGDGDVSAVTVDV